MKIAVASKENKEFLLIQFKNNSIYYPVFFIINHATKIVGLPLGILFAISLSLLTYDEIREFSLAVCGISFALYIIFCFTMFRNFNFSYKLLMEMLSSKKAKEETPKLFQMIENYKGIGEERVILSLLTLDYFRYINTKIDDRLNKSKVERVLGILLIISLVVMIIMKVLSIINK